MNRQTIISIVLGLMVLIIIILILLLGFQKTNAQFLQFCSDKDWNGVHKITGDFSGDINCSEQRVRLFDKGNWTNECSDFPFSYKPSCKWLCIESCKQINQLNKYSCVC